MTIEIPDRDWHQRALANGSTRYSYEAIVSALQEFEECAKTNRALVAETEPILKPYDQWGTVGIATAPISVQRLNDLLDSKHEPASPSLGDRNSKETWPVAKMREVIWQGEPFLKDVRHYGHPFVRAQVTPQVVSQVGTDRWGRPETQMGLVLHCQPQELLASRANQRFTGDLLAPFVIGKPFVLCDPLCWWRVARFLEQTPVIRYAMEFDWYLAAQRHDSAADTCCDTLIQEVRTALPAGSYDNIMAAPIPRYIMTWLIQHLEVGDDLHEARWSLTQEVEAGTVPWSQDLRRIGVQHPAYRRAVNAARQTLTLRYGPYLCSYAVFQGYFYNLHRKREKAWLMEMMEQTLYQSIEKGIERDYGRSITILLAALLTELTSDHSMQEQARQRPDDQAVRRQLRFHPPREERFAQMQRWCAQRGMVTPRVVWEETVPVLQHLVAIWEQLPVVCPLVTEDEQGIRS
jgi:hypothetical protein